MGAAFHGEFVHARIDGHEVAAIDPVAFRVKDTRLDGIGRYSGDGLLFGFAIKADAGCVAQFAVAPKPPNHGGEERPEGEFFQKTNHAAG